MAPKETIELPKASDLQAFNYAVAGHAGTLCDSEGILFIKPCVQHEIDFYEAVRDGHPGLADITPLYMGALMLNNSLENVQPEQLLQQQAQQLQQTLPREQPEELSEDLPEIEPQPQQAGQPKRPKEEQPASADNVTWVPRGSDSIGSDRAVVLENTVYGFKKPNVLDVKLGRRLWADSAPLQKRQRMDNVAAQTTHANLGFRIAGMRVWGGAADQAANEDGAQAATTEAAEYSVDAEGYRIFDKDFGRKQVNDDNVVDTFRRFIFNPAAGIDADHGRAIAQAFKADLERVRGVLERERTRMYSSSLLFVFEGDGEALRAAVEENNGRAAAASIESVASAESAAGTDDSENPRKRRRLQTQQETPTATDVRIETGLEQVPDDGIADVAATADYEELVASGLHPRSRRDVLGKMTDWSSTRTDSGIVIDDEDDREAKGVNANAKVSNVGVEFHLGESDDADADSDSDSEAELPRIFSLRLIDFAHAKFVSQEEGPDENNLIGVRSLIRIFEELAK